MHNSQSLSRYLSKIGREFQSIIVSILEHYLPSKNMFETKESKEDGLTMVGSKTELEDVEW